MFNRSLRFRLLLTFGLGALVLSGLFATLTYLGVHRVLLDDKQQADLKQSYVNAALIRTTLYTAPTQLGSLLDSIERTTDSSLLIQTHRQWLSQSRGASTSDVPQSFVNQVARGKPIEQILVVKGQILFVVGVPIPAVETQFFEVFKLNALERTLRTLLLVLGAGALITLVLGIAGGLWVTRRAVRPLEKVSRAAAAIASGNLSTRLESIRADREVQQLTQSFNEMVSQLVERVERDARFASDVSHELRSPLTTLATTTAVLQRHRDELSAVGRESLDLLTADLAIFQSLVKDLLEMARSDAGAVPLVIETVAAVELVRQSVRSAARRHDFREPPVDVAPSVVRPLVAVDRRRFERVMTNLLENAHLYANGAVAVRLDVEHDHLAINVDDAGPGIPDDEHDAIFERFFRGRAAHDRGMSRGTGLGLALVRDHVRAIGGSIQVLVSPDGGARFRIVLPVVEDGNP